MKKIQISAVGWLWLVAVGVIIFGTSVGKAAELKQLPGHVPAVVKQINPSGHFQSSRGLTLSLGLPVPNQAELDAFLQDLYNPASPQYHHFLSPAQFAQRFSPTPADYQAVKNFAAANGLKIVGEHPNRLVLDVQGSVSAVEGAFHVSINTYPHPKENRSFHASNVEPYVSASLPLLHISGLDDYELPRPHLHLNSEALSTSGKVTPQVGSGQWGAYAGKDFRAAYVPGTSLTGAGQSVALVEFAGFYPNDITTYEQAFSLPNVPVQVVPILGGLSDQGGGETPLDIEMAISMAPGLSSVLVYECPNGRGFAPILSKIADDNIAKQISCSWAISGGYTDSTAEQIFKQMAAQGQSFFTSSGDSDALSYAADYPSGSPNVTSVGGTTLTTSGPQGSYVSEKVWNWSEGSTNGSGTGSSGGFDGYYGIPSYQQGVVTTRNNGSNGLRNYPDVAMTADGIVAYGDNGIPEGCGGTSCAAPLWAGFMALVNEQAVGNGRPTLGFLNPALYAIGKSGTYTANFHDITAGDNSITGNLADYSAVPGYDLCTGWGTIGGTSLINTLAGPPLPQQAPVILNTASLPPATMDSPYSFTYNATGNPVPVYSVSSGALPPGLQLGKDGTISGTPTTIGTFTATVTASNGISPSASQPITMTVAPSIVSILDIFQGTLQGTPLGLHPACGLIQASDGNLYGVTRDGGSTGEGTVFRVTTNGVLQTLHNFGDGSVVNDGAYSNNSLVQANDGNLYGVTRNGGYAGRGTVFRITTSGVLTILHRFGDGSVVHDGTLPTAQLIQAKDGNLYGTTMFGGVSGKGTVFRITPAGVLTILHNFSNAVTDGAEPCAGLLQATDGNLYGVTKLGGTENDGTVFKITTQGVETIIYDFDNVNYYDGQNPQAPLIQGKDGYLYGTTTYGGWQGTGTVFQLSTAGAVQGYDNIIHNFQDGTVNNDGGLPVAQLLQASDGNLYGTTAKGGSSSNYGTVFRMTTEGGVTILHHFGDHLIHHDGVRPEGALIQATDGNLYGTTAAGGGDSENGGIVFKLSGQW